MGLCNGMIQATGFEQLNSLANGPLRKSSQQSLDQASDGLNRTLGDLSLVLAKRKPFDFLAERPFLKNSRLEWTPIELFLGGVAEFDSTIIRLLMAA